MLDYINKYFEPCMGPALLARLTFMDFQFFSKDDFVNIDREIIFWEKYARAVC